MPLVFPVVFKAFDISFFESSMLLLNVFLMSPDSNKFFSVFRATFWADFRIFLPKGVFAVLLINFGEDLITAFPIGSKVLNKELKTPPIPLPFFIKTVKKLSQIVFKDFFRLICTLKYQYDIPSIWVTGE